MKSPLKFLAIGLVLFACSDETDLPIELNNETITLNLAPSGLVNFTDSDLNGGRTPQPDDTYVLISVGNNTGRYASAVFDPVTFDTLSNLSLEIDDAIGLYYSIEVSAFRKGDGYGLRVSDNGGNDAIRVNGNLLNITNEVSLNDTYIPQGRFVSTEIYKDQDSVEYYYNSEPPLMDAYYGRTNFLVDDISDGDTIELDIKRQVFGIELVANNLNSDSLRYDFTGWDLEFKLGNTLDSIYQVRSFGYDGEDDNSLLNIYHKPDGEEENLIFSGNVRFDRLKIKRIEVNVPADGGSDYNNPFEINIVEEPLTRGDTLVIEG